MLDKFGESLPGHKDVDVLISYGVSQTVRDEPSRDRDAGSKTFRIL